MLQNVVSYVLEPITLQRVRFVEELHSAIFKFYLFDNLDDVLAVCFPFLCNCIYKFYLTSSNGMKEPRVQNCLFSQWNLNTFVLTKLKE